MCEHNFRIGQQVMGIYEGSCIVCGKPHTIDGIFKYTGDIDMGHRFKVMTPVYSCPCGEKILYIVVCCNNGQSPIDVTQEFLSLPVRTK